ncbi:glycoside hydrolase family 3 protein [Crucibulum laeve]|uniref:Glycoside hydrolase family 3 protein n=1 Tax=Crucibulum laeve TaxID=68775 RepID=A0A5C3LWP1_9AGAR|nr:glycoside hydrolase family 3 protein [Crucibulum laeve]
MDTLTETIKREIGQHFVFGFHGQTASNDIKMLIKDYFVGNIILMKRNIKDFEQVRSLVHELQLIAKEADHEKPLMIGIDQENGLVSAFSSPAAGTQFPGAMAIAAIGSIDMAEAVAGATANELRLAGINWAYSPVADVNSDPLNPVIGVRSFGDDPKKVAQFSTAVARGLSSNGVASCAKHFPGHGDTHVDSHLSLPRILKSKEALGSTELLPFQSIMEAGVLSSVMTGHMALPEITGDDTPASLSKTITTDILRKSLCYNGVVVTDCLEMDAIADVNNGGCGVEEGAVRSLEAGADIVMICHTFQRQVGALESVYRATLSGRLKNGWIESEKRISYMKDGFAKSWSAVLPAEGDDFVYQWQELKKRNISLSHEAYCRSTAVIWGSKLLSGISPQIQSGKGQILLLTPSMESVNKAVDDEESIIRNSDGIVRNTAGASYLSLASSVKKRRECNHCVYSATDAHIFDARSLDGVSGIIFVMRNADQRPWQRQHLVKILQTLRTPTNELSIPVIVVASCGPYDLMEGFEDSRDSIVYLGTFEFTAEAFEAVVAVIFGEHQATGKVPVSIVGR